MKSLTWINKISLRDQNFKITCEKFEKNFWKKKNSGYSPEGNSSREITRHDTRKHDRQISNQRLDQFLTFTLSIFVRIRKDLSPITLTPNRHIRVDCLLKVPTLRTRPARIRRRFNRSMAKRTQKLSRKSEKSTSSLCDAIIRRSSTFNR